MVRKRTTSPKRRASTAPLAHSTPAVRGSPVRSQREQTSNRRSSDQQGNPPEQNQRRGNKLRCF